MATQTAEDLVDRVQRLTEAADPAAQELLGAVMELYGEGLERIVEILLEAGEPAAPIRAQLLDDGVVASLLLIHDLFPIPLEDRVLEALESVRPYMESHGGGVDLVGISGEGVAHLRLHGSCDGCPASAATLELAIKEALEEAAPDLAGLEVEGVVAPRQRAPAPARLAPAGMELPVVDGPAPPTGFALPVVNGGAPPAGISLPVVQVGGEVDAPAPAPVPLAGGWQPLTGVDGLPAGMLATVEVGGTPLVAARVGERLLVYRDACASCGSSLAAGELRDGLLTCPACSMAYSLPMAGRAFDGASPPLEPVPLLEGPLRVNLGASA